MDENIRNIDHPRDDEKKERSLETIFQQVDFLQEGKTGQEVYDELRKVIIEQAREVEDMYDLQWQYVVHYICEILKNVRHHAGGKGYYIIQAEKAGIPTDKDILHLVVGDYGDGFPVSDGFSIESDFLDKTKDNKEPYVKVRKEGCYGIGGGIIRGVVSSMPMHTVMYNNGTPRIIHNELNEYIWTPKDVSLEKGVHFVGSMLVSKNQE